MNQRCILALIALTVSFARADEKLPPASKPLPVTAWGGVPPDKVTVGRYRELAEAGFTMNFSGFGDVESTIKALDLANTAGVKLMVSCPQLKKAPEETVNRLKSHPALGAYFLRDEPDASLFPKLAAWEKRIYSVDPDHLCYINLLPTYAIPSQLGTPNYPSYLKKYMATVPVHMLSFDHYPVIQEANKKPFLRGDWYDNLEQISAAARKAKVPFWAFALSTKHFSYPAATVANLRCQIFSDLAYGAQGLEYFTYWQITGSSEGMFTDAPIRADGQRTPVYYHVKQVNAEARALWPVFADADVIDIAHAGPALPSGTHRYEPKAPFTSIDSPGPSIVSHLRNGGRDFLVIVNCDINNALKLNLGRKPGTKVQQVKTDGVMHDLGNGDVHLTIDPGDMVVLAI